MPRPKRSPWSTWIIVLAAASLFGVLGLCVAQKVNERNALAVAYDGNH